MSAILRTVDLSKTYNTGSIKINALQNINVEFELGKITAIIGASGSGKSTLLHLLGGIDTDAEGSVLLDNKNILQMNDAKLSRFRSEKIGFIFQFFNLIPELTARENIILPYLISNSKKKNNFVTELSKKLGIDDRLDHYPAMLSGGQQQRVAIARALINNPDILLCDEPTGNLDSKSANEVISLLHDLSKNESKSVIIVTHDNQIAQECDRIITIADGHIIS